MENKSELEKAVNYFNGLTPVQRFEIMNKVEYSKSVTIYYRRSIAYIIENKLYEN